VWYDNASQLVIGAFFFTLIYQGIIVDKVHAQVPGSCILSPENLLPYSEEEEHKIII
jgi:hypothetical protein